MATGAATRLIRLFRAPAEGAFLGMIRKGDRVDIVRTVVVEGDNERWHEVDAKPGHGFVRAKFVRLDDTAPGLSRPAGGTEPEEPAEPEPEAGPSEPAPSAREPSGPKWVKRFPTSRSTATLVPDFRQKCEAFLAALKAAGATVTINATLRPPERAHLMRFSFLIHAGEIDPDDVPEKPGVNIDWVHRRSDGKPDMAKSRAAASAMVDAYDIAFEPSLTSLHIFGKAIDMNVSWSGTLKIKQANGSTRSISSQPKTGLNTELWEVGATYGVIKLPKDKPHWSSTGH
jgi:hypothetical protein